MVAALPAVGLRPEGLTRPTALIRRAGRAPTPRKPTRPTRAAKERRLAGKRQRGTPFDD
ncbi:hypothetical protein [Thiococcus pfennigii]|uniref:hypothetical protein n=1 Tax=Thiococcus pfennigii TaxID=1057 RepID=UPI001907D52C